ncbi:MAG: hypothetical protein NTX86_03505 [Candidatus Dependentiae bacterium]|nr:hypothetical protein [Candidatus Dependentiae bacterium]
MLSLTAKPTAKNLSYLFIVALILRAATFFFYVQHEERYKQADSMDYHNSALAVGLGKGMTNLNNKQPIFWRTPGYPLFLSNFYKQCGIRHGGFTENMPAQKAAIWVQLILCSVIPIIVFFLALSLTSILSIAWITAWISVIHLGLILSSTFLLTEGITLIFFYLFLLFFYKSFTCYGQTLISDHRWKLHIILAAVMLAIATWIRPMGIFVSMVAMLLLAIIAHDSWWTKTKKITLFMLIFFGLLSPWYIRNYQLTGKPFFCPMFGIYLNAFVAPKILRELHNIPLEKTWNYMQQVANKQAIQELAKAQAKGKILCPDTAAGCVAWPIVLDHPWITFKVWMPEVLKSTLDLYSSQLVSFANNSFTWDPLEEFLSEKVALCLYKQKMPLWMRLICWTEFLFSIALWISLFMGIWLFLVKSLWLRFNVSDDIKTQAALWFKLLFMIGAVMFMTGGFGYARLRLPVEPLMIILALSFWHYHVIHVRTKN